MCLSYDGKIGYNKYYNRTFTRSDGNIQHIDVEKNITEVTRALLSPLRTHGYVFGYTGEKTQVHNWTLSIL